MCAHLLPYSLAFITPSPSCAASRRVLFRLYYNLQINSPPDALLHLELRIYTVFAEFALLELGHKKKTKQLRVSKEKKLSRVVTLPLLGKLALLAIT